MNKQLRLALVLRIFRLFVRTLRWVPWRAAQALGDGFGSLAYRFSARYRRIADSNLVMAYGDAMTPKERQKLIKRVFQSFARAIVEFLKAPAMTPAQIEHRINGDVGTAPIDEMLQRGHGVIVITAHFGHWEFLARRATAAGIPLLVIARHGDDPQFNTLIDELRGKGGYRVHPRGASPKALLQHLRSNGVLAILPDQKSDDVFVPFFGRTAGTAAGPATLSLKTGAPIIPMFCPRQPDGTYRVEYGTEIDTTPTGDHAADVRRISTDVNLAIEHAVRRHPEQWLWLHDRWRLSAKAARLMTNDAPDTEADRALQVSH